jgi:hypothetical protein
MAARRGRAGVNCLQVIKNKQFTINLKTAVENQPDEVGAG